MDSLKDIVVTEVTSVTSLFSPKGRAERMKNRAGYGLSFCTEGQITYTHNGKNFVSDKKHIIILPKGQSYHIRGDKSGTFYVINFDCADFLCDTMMLFPIENVEFILNDFMQMKNLFLFERNRAKVLSIFYNIIHKITSVPSDHGVLLPAINYLENNYTNPELTNETLAKQCNISEVYFRKLFLKQYSVTPRQHIIDIRINKAKQLLTDGILKIGAISEMCGFSNPYHFCRLFKEKTGLSPSDYMKQNKIYKI